MAVRRALIIAPLYETNKLSLLPLSHRASTVVKKLTDVLTIYGNYDINANEDTNKSLPKQPAIVTRSDFRSWLRRFFDCKGDQLFFYFYGHGILRDQEGILVTSDGIPDDEGIPMSEVVKFADKSNAHEVVLILDCCHAGAALTAATANSVPSIYKSGHVLLAACAEHQQGWAGRDDKHGELSDFSACILSGLNGDARDGENEVSATLLGHYVTRKYKSWGQSPIYRVGGNDISRPCIITWGFDAHSIQPGKRKRCDFYAHIPYPTYYIARQDLLAEVRNQILTNVNEENQPTVKLYALLGMGGIGKTVIARALCDDEKIFNMFTDGILAASLPHKATDDDTRGWLRDWVRELGGTITEAVPTLASLTNKLEELLHERSCLLIVDNVWEKTQVQPFRVGGKKCRLLITTRQDHIARELEAQTLDIPALDDTQAIMLLEKWSGGTLVATDNTVKASIIKRLGHLPLAIRLAGGQLSSEQLGSQDPETWLKEFDTSKLAADQIKEVHDSIKVTFALSIDTLSAIDHRLYTSLAIFRKDEAIPEHAVARLWSRLADYSKSTTHSLLYKLDNRALLQLNSPHLRTDDIWTITINGLLHEILDERLNDDNERLNAHRSLLATYQTSQGDHLWHTVPNDGYLYDHLIYHLRQLADYDDSVNDQLINLFVNQNWMRARVSAANYVYDGFMADLTDYWQRCYTQLDHKIDRVDTTALVHCIRCAATAASVNSLAAKYIGVLVARALEVDLQGWSPSRAMSVALRIPKPRQRCDFMADLLATDCLTAAQRTKLEMNAWEAALASENEEAQVEALGNLVSHLSQDLKSQALSHGLNIAQVVNSEIARAEMLSRLAPQLNDDFLERGLKIALTITEEQSLARALIALMPKLNDQQLEHAWETAITFTSERNLSDSLVASAVNLKGDLLDRSLQAAQSLQNDELRVCALSALASCKLLDEERRQKNLKLATDTAMSIKLELPRARALSALVPRLTGQEKARIAKKTLEDARLTDSEGSRADILVSLAPHLDDALLKSAIDTALKIQSEWSRIRALNALAKQLDGEQRIPILEDCIKAVSNIKDEWSLSDALRQLAPLLGKDLLERVLKLTLAIGDEASRSEVIPMLVPHLDSKLIAQELEAVLKVRSEWWRTRSIGTLSPRLTEEQLERAVEAAFEITNEESLAYLLIELTPNLTGRSLQRAFDIGIKIESERIRASVLSKLLFQLNKPITMSSFAEMGINVNQLSLNILEATFDITDEGSRSRILAAIAPLLIGKPLERCLEKMLEIADEDARSLGLSTLASQLSGELQLRGLQAAQAIQDKRSCVRALVAFIPHLEPLQKEKIQNQALKIALGIKYNVACAEALIMVTEKMEEEMQHGPLELAMQAVLDIDAKENEQPRVEMLETLARFPLNELQESFLDAALAIKNEMYRCRVLRSFVIQTDGEIRKRCLNAANQVQNAWSRAELLSVFITKGEDQGFLLASIRKAINDHLYHNCQSILLPTLVSYLTNKNLFAPPVFDQSVLSEIAHIIFEITHDWEWL